MDCESVESLELKREYIDDISVEESKQWLANFPVVTFSVAEITALLKCYAYSYNFAMDHGYKVKSWMKKCNRASGMLGKISMLIERLPYDGIDVTDIILSFEVPYPYISQLMKRPFNKHAVLRGLDGTRDSKYIRTVLQCIH